MHDPNYPSPMDNRPDHDQPRFGDFGAKPPPGQFETTRLSLLAVASLVTGLLSLVACCVPVVGVVPIGLGVGSLLVIQRSRGAVAGRGLALAGLMTGVLAMIISSGLWIGVGSMGSKLGPVYNQVLDPDPSVVRTVLTAKAAADVTDGQIKTFQDALHAQHPGKVEIPRGFWQLYTAFARAGGNPEKYQNIRDPTEGLTFPFPAKSDNGWFYIVVLMVPDQEIGSGFPPIPALGDVGFPSSDGSIVWMLGTTSQSPEAPQTDEGAGAPAPGEAPKEDPGG